MPAAHDASQTTPSVQWPTPQTWPLSPAPIRLGVMASGAGSNFEALVSACRTGPLQGEVVQLVVNNPGCGAEERAARLRVPCRRLNHRDYTSREALDRDLITLFQSVGADLIVLAGWMRIVSTTLINAFPERLLNIHPSLLPSFRGLDAVGQALSSGVTISGCTVHLVAEDVDAGPILVQAAVPVLAADTHQTLQARIQAEEHRILPLGVALAAARLLGAAERAPQVQG